MLIHMEQIVYVCINVLGEIIAAKHMQEMNLLHCMRNWMEKASILLMKIILLFM